jgi:hypothetical protein
MNGLRGWEESDKKEEAMGKRQRKRQRRIQQQHAPRFYAFGRTASATKVHLDELTAAARATADQFDSLNVTIHQLHRKMEEQVDLMVYGTIALKPPDPVDLDFSEWVNEYKPCADARWCSYCHRWVCPDKEPHMSYDLDAFQLNLLRVEFEGKPAGPPYMPAHAALELPPSKPLVCAADVPLMPAMVQEA